MANETLTMLQMVKLALRITGETFDPELLALIAAAKFDLQLAGVTEPEDGWETDPLTVRAITTYCKAHFGEATEYERFKSAYDEQKAQMAVATGYTVWGGEEE